MNAAPNLSPTTFAGFYALGYQRLTPVVPHDAAISEKSSLALRVGTDADSRGKAVGVRGADGRWHGFDWVPYESDERDCQRWQAMGAGIGIKTGQGIVAIDADTTNLEWASLIQLEFFKRFGATPCRIGRFPKALYLVAISSPMKYTRVEFGELDAKGRLKDRVEILSDGRQFVAHGIHPDTKAPYTWTRPLVARDQLPTFSPAEIVAFLEELRTLLPAAKPLITEGATTDISQASLRGPIDMVRRAVAATPNTSAAFGTREAYRDYGYAIRAALPDNEPAAFEIFSEWCGRWEDGVNAEKIVRSDWSRFKPPFRRGASWLYELAEQHAPEQFRKVDVFFDVIPEPEASVGQSQTPHALEPSLYTFPSPASIPRRQWVYGDHYIRGFVSATVAPGGLGKSSLTIAEALAMASGKPLLGVKSRGQFRVWLWNGEDPRDELDRRISAAMQHYGLTSGDVGDRLLVDSGMEQEIVLARETRNGALIVEPVAGALISALQRKNIDVFAADPFVSSHKVSENDNGAIDLVVKRWAKIAFITNSSIELVHHVRKTNGEEVTVEDARGASALVNGTRVTRALTRMTAKEGQSMGVAEPWRYFRSGGVAKNNLAPSAGSPADKAEWFTLKSEMLGNGPGHGVEALMTGDAVGVVTRAELTAMADTHDPDQAARAFQLIRAGNWRSDVRAGDAWVGHPIAQAFGLDASDGGDRTRIQGMLKQWRRERRICDEAGRDGARHVRQFVRVIPVSDAPPTCPADEGVFA
ncbi:AAA family ATPase [Bradyrhizobium erythrophlei]|uniref:Uncharacterized protein n=1 Tax=Bradyrhizobium erythrophlei TaxID=1437360 RepID=A0A1M5R302_9BRAD|nr:AAA family ATPase [Bradyrhizobium erythrophlei]SHH20722.1 hypothetical protein SAMN05444169_6316 [Bradyrhizobium erythrophlei]